MKCRYCSGNMKILTYSTLLTSQSNPNEAKRMVYGRCDDCGEPNQWREVFTLSAEETLSQEERNYV